MTNQLALPILFYMSRSLSSRYSRFSALMALLVVAMLFLGASSELLEGIDTGAESCVDCAGCETGECGGEDENPLSSHHHCCTVCCLSHASVALATVASTPTQVVVEPVVTIVSVSLTSCSAETLYRPPRG